MSSRRLKYLLRSKSLNFVRDLKDKNHSIRSYKWNDNQVFYRSSTSDMTLIYEILLKSKYKSEYFLPSKINPKIIFDIGGNIGITSIYLSSLFPDAKIYTFEPLPENFEILQKNIKKYENIRAFNFGLGLQNGEFKVYLSKDQENFGGVSFYPNSMGNQKKPFISCSMKNINEILTKLDINSIDLIKIDTEGSEYDILTSLDKRILLKVSWIIGELHDNRDFELLDYLNGLGFTISLKKYLNNRLFMFNAVDPKIIPILNRKEIKAL